MLQGSNLTGHPEVCVCVCVCVRESVYKTSMGTSPSKKNISLCENNFISVIPCN